MERLTGYFAIAWKFICDYCYQHADLIGLNVAIVIFTDATLLETYLFAIPVVIGLVISKDYERNKCVEKFKDELKEDVEKVEEFRSETAQLIQNVINTTKDEYVIRQAHRLLKKHYEKK